MVDKLIIKLLILDGNETEELNNLTYGKYKQLVVELTKIKYDIRYCSNKGCVCHPEQKIKDLLNDIELYKLLKEKKILSDIYNLINEYEPKVSELVCIYLEQ